MYITAHRVRSLKQANVQGINAFRHRHGEDESIDWNAPNVRLIAETRTGTLVAKSIDVKPGMNPVLSYLDVATADDKNADSAEHALDIFERHISAELPLVKIIEQVGIRFGAQAGLPEQEFVEEYRSLKEGVVALLINPLK